MEGAAGGDVGKCALEEKLVPLKCQSEDQC